MQEQQIGPLFVELRTRENPTAKPVLLSEFIQTLSPAPVFDKSLYTRETRDDLRIKHAYYRQLVRDNNRQRSLDDIVSSLSRRRNITAKNLTYLFPEDIEHIKHHGDAYLLQLKKHCEEDETSFSRLRERELSKRAPAEKDKAEQEIKDKKPHPSLATSTPQLPPVPEIPNYTPMRIRDKDRGLSL